MGRRPRIGPREPDELQDEHALEQRYRWLGRRFLAAVERGSRGEELCARVLEERNRIDRTKRPIAERLAAFENYLGHQGLLEMAKAERGGWTRTCCE